MHYQNIQKRVIYRYLSSGGIGGNGSTGGRRGKFIPKDIFPSFKPVITSKHQEQTPVNSINPPNVQSGVKKSLLPVITASRTTQTQEEDEDSINYQQTPIKAPLLSPREMASYLDDYIIGQKNLKKTMSVAIYNHYKRVDYATAKVFMDACLNDISMGKQNIIDSKTLDDDFNSILIEKSNVLLIGPTGSGKTLIAKTTAKMLDVPFSMNDATPFTQAGYVGEDVEACISRLLQNAEYDVAKAQKGIVFIDEIDKVARRSDSSNPNQRDVSGEGVQQGLLRILEGTTVNITIKPGAGKRAAGPNGDSYSIDTSNILFICSGAFIGLDKIVEERVGSKKGIGFGNPADSSSLNNLNLSLSTQGEFLSAGNSDEQNILDLVESEDLIKFGLIPEFVGRLPVVAGAAPLSSKELTKILLEPKNAIMKQYVEIFRRSDIKLLYHPNAIGKIADIAVTKKTGARGLRKIIETILSDALYEYPGNKNVRFVVLCDNLEIKVFSEMEAKEAFKLVK